MDPNAQQEITSEEWRPTITPADQELNTGLHEKPSVVVRKTQSEADANIESINDRCKFPGGYFGLIRALRTEQVGVMDTDEKRAVAISELSKVTKYPQAFAVIMEELESFPQNEKACCEAVKAINRHPREYWSKEEFDRVINLFISHNDEQGRKYLHGLHPSYFEGASPEVTSALMQETRNNFSNREKLAADLDAIALCGDKESLAFLRKIAGHDMIANAKNFIGNVFGMSFVISGMFGVGSGIASFINGTPFGQNAAIFGILLPLCSLSACVKLIDLDIDSGEKTNAEDAVKALRHQAMNPEILKLLSTIRDKSGTNSPLGKAAEDSIHNPSPRWTKEILESGLSSPFESVRIEALRTFSERISSRDSVDWERLEAATSDRSKAVRQEAYRLIEEINKRAKPGEQNSE